MEEFLWSRTTFWPKSSYLTSEIFFVKYRGFLAFIFGEAEFFFSKTHTQKKKKKKPDSCNHSFVIDTWAHDIIDVEPLSVVWVEEVLDADRQVDKVAKVEHEELVLLGFVVDVPPSHEQGHQDGVEDGKNGRLPKEAPLAEDNGQNAQGEGELVQHLDLQRFFDKFYHCYWFHEQI